MKSIWIPIEEAVVDKEYEGFRTTDESATSYHLCSIIYKGNGVGWIWGKENNKVKNLLELWHHLTYQEEREANIKEFETCGSRALMELHGLFHDCYDTGTARHEMDNSWIECDFYDFFDKLLDRNYSLIGIAPAPYHWTLNDNSVAVIVADMETGETFWCHADKDWINDMREQMQDIYNSKIVDRLNEVPN